jgi:hypothetical protein
MSHQVSAHGLGAGSRRRPTQSGIYVKAGRGLTSGPSRITFLAGLEEVEPAEVLDHPVPDRALEAEVELLERLVGGKRSCRIRPLPPCASRGACSVESRTGRSARSPVRVPGPLRQVRQRPRCGWRLSAPNMCASSEALLMRSAGRGAGVGAGRRRRRRAGRGAAAAPGVFERGDRAVLGERALVAAGELVGVRHHRGDLALGGPPLDAALDYARVERIVVGVKAQIRVWRHPHIQRRLVSSSRARSGRIASRFSAAGLRRGP